MEKVYDYLKELFPDLETNPVIALNADLFLMPLYRQLLNMYIAEQANSRALIDTMQGVKINPIMSEIRKTIAEVQKTINGMLEMDANKWKRAKPVRGKTSFNSPAETGSYYELLLEEGNVN